jgi:hypothetical protein
VEEGKSEIFSLSNVRDGFRSHKGSYLMGISLAVKWEGVELTTHLLLGPRPIKH